MLRSPLLRGGSSPSRGISEVAVDVESMGTDTLSGLFGFQFRTTQSVAGAVWRGRGPVAQSPCTR